MILRETSSWELIDCLYMEKHKKYGLMQGRKVVRFLSPEQLDQLINVEYYTVEKSDIQIANDKGLLTEKKCLTPKKKQILEELMGSASCKEIDFNKVKDEFE